MALAQWENFEREQVEAMCHTMIRSWLVGKLRGVINGVLRSMTERDIEGSEDRWLTLLYKFNIRHSTSNVGIQCSSLNVNLRCSTLNIGRSAFYIEFQCSAFYIERRHSSFYVERRDLEFYVECPYVFTLIPMNT
jgi:hypothetical protein